MDNYNRSTFLNKVQNFYHTDGAPPYVGQEADSKYLNDYQVQFLYDMSELSFTDKKEFFRIRKIISSIYAKNLLKEIDKLITPSVRDIYDRNYYIQIFTILHNKDDFPPYPNYERDSKYYSKYMGKFMEDMRELYVSDNEEFKKIFDKVQDRQRGSSTLITRMEELNSSLSSNGGNVENFYKQKYLKYKQKYTELKEQIGGDFEV